MEMITHLTSELNRINQGCGRGLCIGTKSDVYEGIISLCDNCQKEKETLKKVSHMWVDEGLNMLKRLNESFRKCGNLTHKEMENIYKEYLSIKY
jgi:hypothetical protein